LNTRLGGPQSRSVCGDEENNLFSDPGRDSRKYYILKNILEIQQEEEEEEQDM
jgi:hypothetical protein